MAQHPAVQAMEQLRGEIDQIIMNPAIRPGTKDWYKMQAWGFGLSMLRRAMDIGAHNDPVAFEAFRNEWRRVMVPEELQEIPVNNMH